MLFPLSLPSFAHHFYMSKRRIKHEMYLKVDRMVDRAYEQAQSDLHQFGRVNQSITLRSLLTRKSASTSPDPPPRVSITNAQTTSLPNKISNVQSRPMSIEQSIEIATANEPTVQAKQHPQSASPILNDKQSNIHLNHEKVCECNKCLFGIEIDEHEVKDDDDDDSVKWIEQESEQSAPLVNPNSKMVSTQPNNPQEEVIKQSKPNQLNNHTKHIITLRLQCSELNCIETFLPNEHYITLANQLKDHLWNVHSIRQYRCRVKNCGQSFDIKTFSGDHIRYAHQHTTQWHCAKCPKCFSTYPKLSAHNNHYHQLGHFQCSFPLCTFTSEWKKKVHRHYGRKHK